MDAACTCPSDRDQQVDDFRLRTIDTDSLLRRLFPIDSDSNAVRRLDVVVRKETGVGDPLVRGERRLLVAGFDGVAASGFDV